MGRALLVVFMSGLLTAACASPSLADQVGERVLIRNGFVVPPGKLLLVDDMSVDCVIASEIFDEQSFTRLASKRQRTSESRTRPMPVRKPSIRKASVRHRTTWSAPEPHVGLSLVHPARPARQARLESRGRARDECVRRRRSDAARCLSGRSGQHHQLFHHRRQRPARRSPVRPTKPRASCSSRNIRPSGG